MIDRDEVEFEITDSTGLPIVIKFKDICGAEVVRESGSGGLTRTFLNARACIEAKEAEGFDLLSIKTDDDGNWILFFGCRGTYRSAYH